MWCVLALKRWAGTDSSVVRGTEWIRLERKENGGWSRCPRELPNYVLTALTISLLPGASNNQGIEWLGTAWQGDLGQDVKLSYKGALYLLAAGGAKAGSESLVQETMEYLRSEANDDGGFGPWRGHPIGSDPWSTGVCLAGLCRLPDLADRTVVERATQWLINTQLESGYWPYHYLDEGTAYAYWGLSEAAKLLES